MQKNKFQKTIIYYAFFVLLNFLGVIINHIFHTPLYLDSIGTMCAGITGGYLPAIFVGYITNLIHGIQDFSNIYYASLNAMIGISASYFAKKGYFKKLYKTLITIPVFAFIGGTLGSLLTWCLYGVQKIPFSLYFETKGFSPFLSQISAGTLLDIIDKFIVVLICFVLIKWIPKPETFSLWHQKPLSQNLKTTINKKTNIKSSLVVRVIVLLSFALVLTAVGSAFLCGFLYYKNSMEDHIKLGKGSAEVASKMIQPDKVDEYIKGNKTEDYIATENKLKTIRNISPDIEYVYVYQIKEDGCHVVFDLDTETVKGGELGDIIPFESSFDKYLPDLLNGKKIEPIVSNDSFGWLLTVYHPVYDAKGNCKCYACVDISMNSLIKNEISFLAKLISIFIGFFLLVLVSAIYLLMYYVVLPVNSMSFYAQKFSNNPDKRKGVEEFDSLQIQTGDEIESLYKNVNQTMQNAVDYAEEIQKKGEMIRKVQNGLIMVLADMVESRDQSTGDHIKKTATYVSIIIEHMKKLGIYKEQLTDEFCENVIQSAPLHDIGKIHVSDMILNKPGRLNDEEYDVMKSHTTAGYELVDRAIDTVGMAGYLNEAKDMAKSHHERWDGKGYPNKIKEDDIPLSARIMAVADVFDALMSKRSYKNPFTFEETLDIILQGSGSQFDPEIVRAFVDASDEVKKVAENYNKES